MEGASSEIFQKFPGYWEKTCQELAESKFKMAQAGKYLHHRPRPEENEHITEGIPLHALQNH